MQRTKCFFDIHIDGIPKGRIICQLFNDIVPKTCQNFMQLCQGTNKLGPTTGKMMTYKGCTVHRIKDGKIIETGDFSHNDGTGGESIHGGMFEDENFNVSHVQSFLLTMINQGQPNTNGSQFAFTIFGEPLLDGKNVAFGMVSFMEK
uniref:Peptidyl-prolyl cis-trans isomerase n=1 Tax=Panagrolaimus superbus TaxID=310955 RepID=A0A914YF69_9BILA